MNKKKINVAILYDNCNDWIKKKLNFDFISLKKNINLKFSMIIEKLKIMIWYLFLDTQKY